MKAQADVVSVKGLLHNLQTATFTLCPYIVLGEGQGSSLGSLCHFGFEPSMAEPSLQSWDHFYTYTHFIHEGP